jgi:DNA gyrase subunit A
LKEGESAQALLTTAKLMPAQDVWIGVMHDGRVARSLTEKLSRVSGRQAPMLILKTSTQHSLYLVSEDGRAVSIVMDSIPESEQLFEGTMLSKISPFRDADLISTTFSIPLKKEEIFDKYFVTVSRFGLVKKSSISDLPGPSSQPFLVAKVNPDDALIKVILTDGSSDLCLVSAHGMMIRFSEKDVRPMGLVAAGVNGMKLAEGDYIVSAERLIPGMELFFLASTGDGWRIKTKEIPSQGRYGQGIIVCKSKGEIELIGTLLGKNTQSGVIHFQKAASRMIRIDEIGLCRRNTMGKPAIQVKPNDSVFCLSSIWDGLAFWKEKS